MQIYKICPHCDKKLFLIYELEFSMYWAKDEFELHKKEERKDKDTGKWPEDYEGDEEPIRYPDGYDETIFPDRHIKEDWNALLVLLHELQNNHGPRLHIAFDDKEQFRIKKLEKTPDGLAIVGELAKFLEKKVQDKFLKEQKDRKEAEERKKKKKEDQKKFDDGHNWAEELKTPLLTPVIKAMWISKGFDFEYVRQVVITYTQLQFNDYGLAAYLRDKEGLATPTDILNSGRIGELKAKYYAWLGKKKPKEEPPPPPERKNLRGWQFDRALTSGEWLKINNSDLAFIVSSYLKQHLYTIDEAHELIRNAVEWTPSESTTPPTWPEVLKLINGMYADGAKPDSFRTIDNFLKKNEFPDPMAGINLMGVPKTTLLTNFAGNEDTTAKNEIGDNTNGVKGKFVKWKEYIPFNATGDGNCFFNSFSIYLIGDESLATRLRVAVCIGLLTRKLVQTPATSSHLAILGEINKKVARMSVNTGWEAWRELGDAVYVAALLERPIRVLYRPEVSGWDPNTALYKEVMSNGRFALSELYDEDEKNRPIYNYNEYWTIYHRTGNHFVPLIHPTKKEVIGPQGKQAWGDVNIAFYVSDVNTIGTPTPTNINYIVDKPKKLLGLPSGDHPDDTKAGNLKGYEIKQVNIGSSDIPANGVNQIKTKGIKKIKVVINGNVNSYTDGDNILTFQAGVEVRQYSEGVKTHITVVLVNVSASNKLADPNSYIELNIGEKTLGQNTPGEYPQTWPDTTKFNGNNINKVKLWVKNAQFDTEHAKLQGWVGRTIIIISDYDARAYNAGTKTIEIADDFKLKDTTIHA